MNDNPASPNGFFSGGGGFFIEYFDVVRPIYLFAIINMLINDNSYGLPINILSKMNPPSILEWYLKRRYINPLKCLDLYNLVSNEDIDKCIYEYIQNIPIYKISPNMNIHKMMSVYTREKMNIPVFIYTDQQYNFIEDDISSSFSLVNVKYVYGDINKCLEKCDNNFTYIFSNLNTLRKACEFLKGSCSHILLSREYRYNTINLNNSLKDELYNIMISHPFLRIGTTTSIDIESTISTIIALKSKGEEK